jgi:hypothetical protein
MAQRLAKSEALGVKITQPMQMLRRNVVERGTLGDRGASWARLHSEAA